MVVPVFFDDQAVNYNSAFGRFSGLPTQRSGRGLGNLIRTNYPFLLPLLKSAGEAVAREGVAAAGRTVVDVAEKRVPIRRAIRRRSARAVRRLVRQAEDVQTGGSLNLNRTVTKPLVVAAPIRKSLPRKAKRKRIAKKKILKKDALGRYT
jgi:hypothetical protein